MALLQQTDLQPLGTTQITPTGVLPLKPLAPTKTPLLQDTPIVPSTTTATTGPLTGSGTPSIIPPAPPTSQPTMDTSYNPSSIPPWLQNTITATQSPGGAGPTGALAPGYAPATQAPLAEPLTQPAIQPPSPQTGVTPMPPPPPIYTGGSETLVQPKTLPSTGTITDQNLIPPTQPGVAQPGTQPITDQNLIPPGQPAVQPPAPQGTLPDGTFGPGSNLVNQQIGITPSAGTQQATSQLQQLLQRLGNQPSITDSASQLYQSLLGQAAPGFQAAGRSILQDAAANGRLGSGMTTEALTSDPFGSSGLGLQLGKYQAQLAQQLAGQLAPAQAQYGLAQLGAVGGAQNQLFGQDVANTNQQTQQQGYQAGLAQEDFNNQLQNALLGLQGQNQNFNQNLATAEAEGGLGFGNSAIPTEFGVAGQYGQQGQQGMSAASQLLQYLQSLGLIGGNG